MAKNQRKQGGIQYSHSPTRYSVSVLLIGGAGGLGTLGIALPIPAPKLPASPPKLLPRPLSPFGACAFRLRAAGLCAECPDDGVAALTSKAPGEEERESGEDECEGSRSRKEAVDDSRSLDGTLEWEFIGGARW